MLNKKMFLAILFFILMCVLTLRPDLILGIDSRIIIYDAHAPLYTIQVNYLSEPEILMLHNIPYTMEAASEVHFYPEQSWMLILLVEESVWVSPVEQNSILLTIMDKMPSLPEKMMIFSFNTSVNEINSDWKNPVTLEKSAESKVQVLDALQRINQIANLKDQNCLICIIGSGKNTGNLTRVPSVFCPVWFFFQDNEFMKHSPYLKTLSSCSGGRIYTYNELENIKRLELPPLIQSQVICFTVPYQWTNFQQKIRLTLQEGNLSHLVQLKYPIPWLSFSGIIFFVFIFGIIFFYYFHQQYERRKAASKIHHFGFAWLEWTDTQSVKQIKRIQSCDFTIGSNPNCHLSLQEDSVSDFHALIQEKNTIFTISDLSSRYGVLINQLKVNSQSLRDGDMIQIGNIYLTFRQSYIKYESNEKFL